MTGTIGCIGLIAIAVFIILLALWSRKSRRGVAQFYAKYSLDLTNDGPESVRELIGSPNLVCRRGSINEVRFNWWEWFISSTTATTNSHQTTIDCFLAISFAPDSVSEEFKRIAAAEYKEGEAFSLKKAVGYETSLPIRVETLQDGTFVVFWRVLQRPHIMEHKMEWLKKNLATGRSSSTGDENFVVVEVEADLALMMMQPDGDYIASEMQTYTYYFLAPRAFANAIFENATREIGQIYIEHQKVMREREPDDPNYIAVVGIRPRLLSPAERAGQPWLRARVPVWEESVCIAIRNEGIYKLSPTFFTGAITAANS